MEHVLAYCTFPEKAKAEEVAEIVVRERLAACANVFSNMQSIYQWQGRVEKSEEIPVFFKTTRGKFKTLKGRIQALHPYSNPCLIALPIVDGLPEFLKWISVETL